MSPVTTTTKKCERIITQNPSLTYRDLTASAADFAATELKKGNSQRVPSGKQLLASVLINNRI